MICAIACADPTLTGRTTFPALPPPPWPDVRRTVAAGRAGAAAEQYLSVAYTRRLAEAGSQTSDAWVTPTIMRLFDIERGSRGRDTILSLT